MISINKKFVTFLRDFFLRWHVWMIAIVLSAISIFCFIFYLKNGLGLSYNDARSHLDIGRRVVEGLKPGIAQIGSVWLPLPHLLMAPTIWNDFMWHSGLAGAIQSMISFVVTGLLIYKILEKLSVGILGRIIGVLVFTLNLNNLYLQSTAMTEPLLLATMTAGCYYLLLWSKDNNVLDLIKSAFWIMLSTLVRYDGWFLLMVAVLFIVINTFKKRGYKVTEGTFFLFCTLGGLGIILWLLWNQLIFNDALYFALGPFSAHAQQTTLKEAGVLPSEHNLLLSTQIYIYSFLYNSYTIPVVLGIIGYIVFLFDKTKSLAVKLTASSLLAPFVFNILALFFGFSVIFVQGISGNTWFNIRYGVMLMPFLGVFIGILVDKFKEYRYAVIALVVFTCTLGILNQDAVTIDDAQVGSSQKNVSEVSGFLKEHALNEKGFVLISAASHDAIIFSSGLPMKRFIHEGTGAYWTSATTTPDRWARWIIMRTYDNADLTWKAVSETKALEKYDLVGKFPFADIYQLKPEYINQLQTEPVFGKQK